MSVTYHIRIKKDYATAIIEDLRKMEAVEVVSETEAFRSSKGKISAMRGKITPMTNEQIDQQLNDFRKEWERDI